MISFTVSSFMEFFFSSQGREKTRKRPASRRLGENPPRPVFSAQPLRPLFALSQKGVGRGCFQPFSLKVVVPQRSIVPLGFHAAVLESSGGSAGAGVVPAEFFFKLFVPVNDAQTAFYPCLGRVSLAALVRRFKTLPAR
jgi:hypothetical protein